MLVMTDSYDYGAFNLLHYTVCIM